MGFEGESSGQREEETVFSPPTSLKVKAGYAEEGGVVLLPGEFRGY